jgi:hypothetical protein
MTDDDDPDLFSRPTDPDESRKAAARVRLGKDRLECFFLFCLMMDNEDYISNRNDFQWRYLPDCKYSASRAHSLRRRLSDIVVRRRNPFPPTLWLLKTTGLVVDGSMVLELTEWGEKVRDNPKLMTGLWGHQKNK